MKIERSFLTLAFVLLALASVLPAGTIYLLPTGTASQTVTSYSQEPFLSLSSFDIPANTASVYFNASAAKLYAVGKSAEGAIVVQTPGSATPLRTINLSVGPSSSTMTPDGRYLAVLAAVLRVYDTNNDSEYGPATGFGFNVGASPTMILSDLSSSRILVMSSAEKSIRAVDLATKTVSSSPLVLGAEPQTMAVGPNGLLYVSAQNRLYEIEPRTLTLRGEIALSGTPGRLSFTPDGTKALAVDTTPINSGYILYCLDLTNRTILGAYPYARTITLDQVVVTSNDRAYGLSLALGNVYRIGFSPLVVENANISELGTTGKIVALTQSNEAPFAKNLYFMDSTSLYVIDLINNRRTNTSALSNPASEILSREVTTGQVSSFLLTGNNQSVVPGGVSAPVVVRAMNGDKPVFDAPVEFTTGTAGASILSATSRTDMDGYAVAYVSVPNENGTVAVHVRTTAGNQVSADFTLNVGTSGGGGTTPSTGAGVKAVSGDGQVVFEVRQTDFPLRVKVTDDNGNPVADEQVTWAITNGTGYLSDFTSTTDQYGIAQSFFIGGSVTTGLSFVQSTVTATAKQGSASFVATTVLAISSGGGTTALPTLTLQTPDPGVGKISGKLGAVLKGAVAVRASIASGPQIGYPVPNVGLFLTSDQDPTTGPVPACVGGTALSDSNGLATCDVIISGHQGTANFSAKMGGDRGWSLTVTAEPGDPGEIKLIQGDGQSGNPGTTLPLALVGEVSDGYGNKLSGAEVIWEVVTPNSLTLINTASTSDATGRVSTRVTLGSMGGTYQVRVRSKLGSAVALFTVTVNVQVSSLNKVSGDNQNVLISTAFPQPLVVKVVDAQNAGVQGVAVAFAVTSGTATLSAATATTGADGTASVNATAGATPGTILVKASISGFSVTFTLTARLAGPEVTAAGIVNGVGGQAGVVPGGIVSIYGKGIAPNLSGSITGGNLIGPLPLKLADVEVLFGSTAAPIYNVSNINGMESVTVQAPFELGAPGTVSVTVKVAGASTVVPNVPTFAIQPGLFETLSETGVRYAVAIGDDGRYLGPGQGARPGEIVRLFVTGVGQTTPATATNRAGVPGQKVAANLIVGFNNEGVRVVSAEYMVGVVGVYIVSFEVPSSATSGSKPLVVAAVTPDGTNLIYSNPSTLTVQ